MTRTAGHSLWRQEGDAFVNEPFSPEMPSGGLPANEFTLPTVQPIRNAALDCQIEPLSEPVNFHAGVLFRKNGSHYLGAGIGGWRSRLSLFARDRDRIAGLPIGMETSIVPHHPYHIVVECRAGYITNFAVDGERQILESVSIKDALGSRLAGGHIGLYAWAQTSARFSVKVTALPNRCFMITNISEGTRRRQAYFARLLQSAKAKHDLQFLDATDLSREQPLMRKIKEGITSSDFVIADFGFEEPRPNVLYETGIAHSLGVPTIHIGPSKECFGRIVPSDLKAQFFLLREEVATRLPATVDAILEARLGNFDYLGGE